MSRLRTNNSEFKPETLEKIVGWIEDWKKTKLTQTFTYYVGVDIGGTNTRLAIGYQDESVILTKFKARSTSQQIEAFQRLEAVIYEEIFHGIASQCVCGGAALAGAGRILENGTQLDITNFPGKAVLCKEELPSRLFPSHSTYFLNDLESASYGIVEMSQTKILSDYFTPLWNTPTKQFRSPQNAHGNYLIIAPGTGLGASLLVYVKALNAYTVVALEAGHTVVHPMGPRDKNYAKEKDMIEWIAGREYNGRMSIEYEDIICGQGVVNIYQWLCARGMKPTLPAEANNKLIDAQYVVDHAFSKRVQYPQAVKALYYHYRYLARFSANLGIATQVDGIFWAGTNQVINDAFIRQRADKLRNDFFKHPKGDWLQDVGVFGQTKHLNINILGTIHIAKTRSKVKKQHSKL
mmetsp:Transcript_4104/g.6162  ORF Transcript_4104/g.6162 Transcript_4104/m.6162 type:complete len:407 (-) Transcript_4104:56-1276(-)